MRRARTSLRPLTRRFRQRSHRFRIVIVLALTLIVAFIADILLRSTVSHTLWGFSASDNSVLRTTASQRKWFGVRTIPLAPPTLRYEDLFDPLPPRPGEAFISFTTYLDCLEKRLFVNRRAQVEYAFPPEQAATAFPYLMVPAMSEIRDIKALMCNISVPIRRLLYIQNGAVPAMTAFFDDVQRAFHFTHRMKIHRYPDNIGFAGAVNAGFHDAMRYSFKDVPFYCIFNNDVRFPRGLLEDTHRRFLEATKHDYQMIALLEAEVKSEPNEYTPQDRVAVPLRSSGGDTYLVTSRLLPDRIRYAEPDVQNKAFSSFYGAVFYDGGRDTSAWGLSRLAMETVGSWDENAYPAYFEDTDWRWRQMRLGFQDFIPRPGVGERIHYASVTVKSAQDTWLRAGEHDRVTTTSAGEKKIAAMDAYQRAFSKAIWHVLSQKLPNRYILSKWAAVTTEAAYLPYIQRAEVPHPTRECYLPIDAWVRNVDFLEAVAEAVELGVTHFLRNPEERKEGALFYYLQEVDRQRLMPRMWYTEKLFSPSYYIAEGKLKKLPASYMNAGHLGK